MLSEMGLVKPCGHEAEFHDIDKAKSVASRKSNAPGSRTVTVHLIAEFTPIPRLRQMRKVTEGLDRPQAHYPRHTAVRSDQGFHDGSRFLLMLSPSRH